MKEIPFFQRAALLLLPALLLTGCGQAPAQKNVPSDAVQITAPAESSAVLYVNQQLGFTMDLPLDWLGQIEIEEEYDVPLQNGGSCITVYHRQTHESEGSGVLFFIDCFPGDWSEENPPVQAGQSTVVLKANDFTCLLRTPSDVEYSETNEDLASSYQALSGQLDALCGHFSTIS